MTNKTLHLRGLNGIRAIAALAVVFSHISLELKQFGLAYLFVDSDGHPRGINLASFGVSMFFTLSGFLITYLLLLEKEKIKTVNIRKFYIRRALRIWPLYYVYILFCLLIYILFKVDFSTQGLPLYIFLMANFALVFNMMLPYMGHLWSIGVEEQFYLFWPWIAKIKNSKLLKFSIIFVVVFYLLKLVLYLFSIKYPSLQIVLTSLTVTRFHIMIIGCIAAILFYNQHPLIKWAKNFYVQLICWTFLFLMTLGVFQISSALVDHEIIALTTILIIISQISRENIIVDLDLAFFDFIGRISYGIYVIHPLIIFMAIRILGKFDSSTFLNYILVYSFIISATIGTAYFSYRIFERRFIRLKSKFANIKSSA